MLDIEQAIREVGTVYQALTGRPIEAGRSDLPPDADAQAHIEDRYRQFRALMDAARADAGAASAPQAHHARYAHHAHQVQNGPAWVPPLTVIEGEAEVRYELDVPAVSRADVSVAVLDAFVVVRGRRGTGAPDSPARAYSERPEGPFQRVIALPARARRDAVVAQLREGVLAIVVPTDGPAGAAVPIEIR
jgi:HSP20 family molecular chaperone IbpA